VHSSPGRIAFKEKYKAMKVVEGQSEEISDQLNRCLFVPEYKEAKY
jgi:cell fate (sporulation/competence/biofilm development) regulator YmcA (YheA/YmcA/DUF963 family)